MKTRNTVVRRNRVAELFNHVMNEEAKNPAIAMYLELAVAKAE